MQRANGCLARGWSLRQFGSMGCNQSQGQRPQAPVEQPPGEHDEVIIVQSSTELTEEKKETEHMTIILDTPFAELEPMFMASCPVCRLASVINLGNLGHMDCQKNNGIAFHKTICLLLILPWCFQQCQAKQGTSQRQHSIGSSPRAFLSALPIWLLLKGSTHTFPLLSAISQPTDSAGQQTMTKQP